MTVNDTLYFCTLLTLLVHLLKMFLCCFQIRVLVYDTEYRDQTSTAVVPVVVTRNANAPIFERPEYRQSLAENHRLGSSVLQLKASDQDQV